MATTDGVCVGRDDELADLGHRLRGTTRSGAALVLLTGPVGIGRTTLLRQLTATAPGSVLLARCEPWEAEIPGALLRQLLQEEPPKAAYDAADALVERIDRDAPALVVLDDAQWADVESLQAISTVLRHHRRAPVLFVAGLPRRTPVLDRLTSAEVRLDGLDAEAVAEVAAVQGVALPPFTARRLTTHTGGNPRAVVALLDETPGPWGGPDVRLPAPAYVTKQVAERLDALGDEGRALVKALAILGEDPSFGEAARLADLSDPLAAVDEADRADLLAPRAGLDLRLSDRLTHAAVLDLMGAQETAAAHCRAARIVHDPARRIQHLVAAAPLPDAALADEADRLARELGAEGAWSQAADLLRDAARLTPPDDTHLLHDDRLTRSVDAQIASGDAVGAATLVPVVEGLRETPLRDAVLAYLAVVRGRVSEADLRLRRAWEIVNAEREPEVAALVAQRFVLHTLVRCRGEELVEWADRAAALAGDGSPVGLEAAAIRGLGLAGAGRSKEATEAYAHLRPLVPPGAQTQRVTMGQGWLQLVNDDIEGARGSLEAAASLAFLHGSERISLWALGWLARVQFLTGDWDAALGAVRQGRDLTAVSGIVLAAPLLEWTAAQIHSLRGSWSEARAAVRAAEGVTQGYEMLRIPTLLARAVLAESESDYGLVRRTLTPLVTIAAGTTLDEPGFWPWADVLANAWVLEGNLTEAAALLDRHEPIARERGHRSTLARLGYARGRLLGAGGDLAAARLSFEAALAQLDGLPLRYDLARVRFAYGQTLRRAGRRREADDQLSAARELYLGLGAQTYVARCDQELKAGQGTRSDRSPAALTHQEEQVADLVASGLSNKDVAARLFVSPKTVQYHLTRIYTKLGIRSRTELAAVHRSV